MDYTHSSARLVAILLGVVRMEAAAQFVRESSR